MLFEAFSMAFIEEETPVNSVVKTVREYPHLIRSIFRHRIGRGKKSLNLSKVSAWVLTKHHGEKDIHI